MYISKDEERKALTKIRGIVESLGADSYIAAAFKECFEKAEENIDNDCMCNYFDDYVQAMYKLDECRWEKQVLEAELKFVRTELEQTRAELTQARTQAETYSNLAFECHEQIDKASKPLRLFECIVDDDTDVFKALCAEPDKETVLDVYGGNGEFIRIKDVTNNYFTGDIDPTIDHLYDVLKNSDYSRGERVLICRLLEQHIKGLNR